MLLVTQEHVLSVRDFLKIVTDSYFLKGPSTELKTIKSFHDLSLAIHVIILEK